MSENQNNPLPKINLWKLILPVAIGVGVSAYLIITNFNPEALRNIQLTQKLIVGLLLATATVILRDGAFMYKLRLSSGSEMTWRKTFQTIIMWEFTACITPKVAEAPFVLYLLKKSGLTYGKSVAVLMLNSFLDNIAFVLVFSVLYIFLGQNMLQFSNICPDLAGHQIMQGVRSIADKAWLGYIIFLSVCIFLGTTLFLLPHSSRVFFHRLSALPILSNFKTKLVTLGDDIEITANEFKNMPTSFWIKMSVSTFINWIARFLLACALLYAFSDIALNIWQVLSRQYVLWIFTSIPSTPGASGVAEISFIALNCEFIPLGLSAAIALIWRMFSYYLYLIIGLFLLPKWSKQIAVK